MKSDVGHNRGPDDPAAGDGRQLGTTSTPERLAVGDGGSSGVQPIAVDARGVARLFSLGVRTVRRWADSGRLPPSFKLGARRLWRVRDLERWAAAGFPPREASKRGV